MNCREIQDLLTPYLLGDLEPAQAAEVRAHLQTCELCRDSVADLQATLQLLREGLADTSAVPPQLPEPFILQFKKRRWRRPRIVNPKSTPRHWWVSISQYAAVAAVLLILAGLMLPNLSSVREKARRVNDLSNLNGIWKSASAWGLNPSDSFRPAFPPSLDELAKEANLPPEMLVNPSTGKPVEYYPGAASSDRNHPLLVSQGKGGRNVVKATGQGMWVEDGTPEAEALNKQLAGLPKQVASVSHMSATRQADASRRRTSASSDYNQPSAPVVMPPPPPKAASIADANFKRQKEARFFHIGGAVSGSESDESGGVGGSVNEVSDSPSAGKDKYASAAPVRSDKPANALRLKESESTERKEELTKPLEIAALSSIRRDSSRLTADYAADLPAAAPPTPKQETKAETKEVKVTTTAAAVKTAVTRITVAAPTEFVRKETLNVMPVLKMAEVKAPTDMSKKIEGARIARLRGVAKFQKDWSVSGSKHSVKAKFALFKAKYQDGDWNCNPDALNNLLLQIRAWSKDRIDAKLVPEVIDIGTDRLFTLKPPFVYLTGSRGINLRDNEVRNMRDYLMLGGAIWVDSASPGKGNLFDLSVRREMKRVLPDRDFEVVPSDHEMYDTFFDNIGQPPGWANSREPTEMINFGGKLAVLYTLNNYGKLWTYRLDKDGRIDSALSPQAAAAESQPTSESAPYKLVTDELVRNAYKFGINIVVHLLTRYQRDLMLLPKVFSSNSSPLAARSTPAVSNTPPVGGIPTNAVPAPEPAASNVPPVTVPICRATGVNPFVSAAAKPFSTFSIDVDTASYTLSRNYLLRGQLPPPEAVRTEEFVNYFEYDYAPPNGPTFAVYTDCGPSAFGRGLSLLKIGVKGRRLGREEKRAAVLTLLIDTSGSMATPDRIELVKSALSQMVERLDPADKVAIVQYDSHARLLLEHTPASDKKRILAVIEGLQTSGSTALEEGMREAYATAARGFNSAACNRVMLLSDGMANLGTMAAEEILKSIEGYRKQGITLSVFGFGLGAYNDVMLETLANKGDGVYSFIDSPAEAKRALVDDLAATVNLIARDVKIQVEFNPKRVKQYRQLGYENRQLKKEEFRDDSVDAGEIGSGQSVTALYELELQGDPHEPLGMVRVRCRNALTGQIEEIEQPIAPPSGTTPFEAMDVRFRLAAAAAEFAEILRGSPFAAGNRFEDVARILRPIALELSLDNRIQELLRLTQTGLTPKFQKAETP